MMPRIPHLTERQVRFIREAANALPLERRDDFTHSVFSRLTSMPSDYAVLTVVNNALTAIPIAEQASRPALR